MRTLLAVSLALMLCVFVGCKTKGSRTATPSKGSGEAEPAATAKQEGDKAAKAEKKSEPKKAVKADPKQGPAKAQPKRTADKAEPAAPPIDLDKIPEVVAKVNGSDIKAPEYKEELSKIMRRNAKIPPDRFKRISDNILKRMIEKELIAQEIKKQSIAVSEADIDEAFKEYKKRFRTEEQFQNYLKHGKVTVDKIRDRMKAKKALEKLIEKSGNLQVTDAEADEFYKKNERFYIEKEGIRARHVLVKVAQNAPKEKVEAAKEKLSKAQAELKKGTDFAEVAKKFGEGPAAAKGGDLGFFGKGQMVKPFEEAAFGLKVGQMSEPVRTRFGFHIIKVEEKRAERKKPLDEVKEQILKSLRNKKFFKERRALIQRLNEEAKVEKFI